MNYIKYEDFFAIVEMKNKTNEVIVLNSSPNDNNDNADVFESGDTVKYYGGGAIEKKETPEQATLREAKEETKYNGKSKLNDTIYEIHRLL